MKLKDLEKNIDFEMSEKVLFDWIPTRAYCKTMEKKPKSKRGASQEASCKAQGFLRRSGKKRINVGTDKNKNIVKLKGTTRYKSKKYGGPVRNYDSKRGYSYAQPPKNKKRS